MDIKNVVNLLAYILAKLLSSAIKEICRNFEKLHMKCQKLNLNAPSIFPQSKSYIYAC